MISADLLGSGPAMSTGASPAHEPRPLASVANIFQNQNRLKSTAPSRRSTMFTGDMSLQISRPQQRPDYLGDGGRIGCNPARTGKAGAGCRSQTKFQYAQDRASKMPGGACSSTSR